MTNTPSCGLSLSLAPTLHDELCGPCLRQPRYRIARTLDEVVASWHLVYQVYLEAGLIGTNAAQVHFYPHMVDNRSVIVQKMRHRWCSQEDKISVEATLSGVEDGPTGLPLDSVYRAELDELRQQGRRLVEVGQFAHHRLPNLPRHADHAAGDQQGPPNPGSAGEARMRRMMISMAQTDLIRLTSYALEFGLSIGATDFVIGVHPRHSRFYQRAWGFLPYGGERTYPVVNDRPVVLLRGDWHAVHQLQPRPYGLAYCAENPLPDGFFSDRFFFDAPQAAALPRIFEDLPGWSSTPRSLVA